MIHIHVLENSQMMFHLQTKETSYIVLTHPFGHLLQLYYGKKLSDGAHLKNMYRTYATSLGSSTSYAINSDYTMDAALLEAPIYGKGDYRIPSIEMQFNDGTRITDFIYDSYKIHMEKVNPEGLPHVHSMDCHLETLEIILTEKHRGIVLSLFYTPVYDCDSIVRFQRLVNASSECVEIHKAMSFNCDIEKPSWHLLTLDGMWIRERQWNSAPLRPGIHCIDSKKGVSGANHNPFIALHQRETTELSGECYGFSLLYSGNFTGCVEVSPYELTRVQMGISDFDFSWHLNEGEAFDTPEGVLTYSSTGFSKMSHNFHILVQRYIIQTQWQNKPRPVLINNWEATYFDFNEKKLLKLAKAAADVGIELFVLDDGWFKGRNDDRTSLGDWVVDQKKLPKGLNRLSKDIKALGMDFGLWVEPEMVSPQSELYSKHPSWVIALPDRLPSLGRNQCLLDLSNPEVIEHLFSALESVFSSADIRYVKWDMNRNFSDLYSNHLAAGSQKSIGHRYVLGLYQLLKRLINRFPEVLFESCSSGGNRYDLGMLFYMPQTWTSDNTDALERMEIQYGTSLVYPLSTMGAHVSGKPSHQVLRHTPLETRFNVAAFGLLGYELDLTRMSPFELKVIKKQIQYYKEHRMLLQFGTFYRLKSPFIGNDMVWQVISEENGSFLIAHYQKLQKPSPPLETLYPVRLNPEPFYRVVSRTQYQDIRAFGELINPYIPIDLKDGGILQSIIANRYLYEQEKDEFELPGECLMHAGMRLKAPFVGTGINDSTRLLGDFGSRMYYGEAITQISNQEHNHG